MDAKAVFILLAGESRACVNRAEETVEQNVFKKCIQMHTTSARFERYGYFCTSFQDGDTSFEGREGEVPLLIHWVFEGVFAREEIL